MCLGLAPLLGSDTDGAGSLCNVLPPNSSPNHVFQTKLENISLKDVMNSVEI